MIFVLFLVSVGVMEVVLQVNKRREKIPEKLAKPAEVPSGGVPSITPDLLSLAKAIRAEAPAIEPSLVEAEYNRKDAPAE